jgi:hypothetical protein
MSVDAPPTLHEAVRVARRAVTARFGATARVPRLRVGGARASAAPTVWMICPDWDKPAGGIRVAYRAVDALNEAGIAAAIVHRRPGFACTWFAHRTKVVAGADVVVSERDVIVVPEVYGPAILDLPAGVRRVIFNQNAYLTLDSLRAGPAAAAPYVNDPDLAAVLVVSDDNAGVLAHAFPGAPIRRIRLGIDPAVHHPPAVAPRRRIAYMPRRRVGEAAQVLGLLGRRGLLDEWDLVAIDGCSEAEAADLLRSSRIFLSFSEREGFGLPPCEALACGCLVVGYDGFAGREFFRAPFARSVEDGDVVAFARAAERLARRVDEDPAGMAAASEAGARFVRERYSPAIHRQDLVAVLGPLLEGA